MVKKYFPVFLISLLLWGECAMAKGYTKFKSIKFPPTSKVDFLEKEPDEPFIFVALIELKGGSRTSLRELFIDMIKQAKRIGADAIIPAKNVDENSASDSLYKSFLAGRQKVKGVKVPIIKGNAIKYISSVKKLIENGFDIKHQKKPFALGLQLDMLPYILNGGNASFWIGKNSLRLKGNISGLNIPKAFLNYGYENGKIETAYGLFIDYFIHEDFKGFWISNGFEYWEASLGHILETGRGSQKNIVYSLGVGYSRQITKHFYVSTQIAGKLIVNGKWEIKVGTRTGHFHRASPCLALEFGWQY